VNLLVYFEVARLSESFVALFALVGLLASVLPHVHSEHASPCEAVSAALVRTGEVLDFLVNALNVIFQVSIRSKHLGALRALKASLVFVRGQVTLK
jgi:hypothetical protein